MEKVDIQQRSDKARELFKNGYNCAQAVFLAYCDLFDVVPEFAATISAPFGGGMGRMREVCGAVSGMTIAVGFISPNNQPNDNVNKQKCYATVQELAERFRLENGSIVCRELLGLAQQKDDPTPSPRTEEYYKKRPCSKMVEEGARIFADYLEGKISV